MENQGGRERNPGRIPEMSPVPRQLPLLSLPNLVLLPGNTVRLHCSRLPFELSPSQQLCCVEQQHFLQFPLSRGCLAEVQQLERVPTGVAFTLVGLRRLQIRGSIGVQVLVEADPFLPWPGGPLPEFSGLRPDVAALRQRIDGALWLDMVAFHLPLPLARRWALQQQPDPRARAHQLAHAPRLAPVCLSLSAN